MARREPQAKVARSPAPSVPRKAGRPRDGDSAATRLAVLDAALTEFALTGFAGTSTRAICERSGLTSSTVYHHFGSKRGLFIEAYRHAIELVSAQYVIAVVDQPTLRAELAAVLRCGAAIMDARYEITAFLIRAQTELTTAELDANSAPGAARDFVAGMTQRAVARKELRPSEAPFLALTVPALLWGLSLLGRPEHNREILVEALDRLVQGTLISDRPPPRVRRSSARSDPAAAPSSGSAPRRSSR